MDSTTRNLLEEAKRKQKEVMNLLSQVRESSPNNMLTRNAFLMSVKTYDLTVESLQRNAPSQASQPEVSSLYNSHDGE